jgi:hypothetical protein
MLPPDWNMKRNRIIGISLPVIGLFILCPVQAFTAKSLVIDVNNTGDAVITFDYQLSWIENVAVFVRIADPGTELKKAFESNFHAPVAVMEAGSGRSQLYVKGFASETLRDGNVTLTTPALDFREAEQVLDQYWFAPLINPDFSPAVTRIVFPDGYEQVFNDQDQISRVSHTLGS